MHAVSLNHLPGKEQTGTTRLSWHCVRRQNIAPKVYRETGGRNLPQCKLPSVQIMLIYFHIFPCRVNTAVEKQCYNKSKGKKYVKEMGRVKDLHDFERAESLQPEDWVRACKACGLLTVSCGEHLLRGIWGGRGHKPLTEEWEPSSLIVKGDKSLNQTELGCKVWSSNWLKSHLAKSSPT